VECQINVLSPRCGFSPETIDQLITEVPSGES